MHPGKLLPILLLAAALPAQTKGYLYSPAAYATKEASYSWYSAISDPGGQGILQQVHGDLGTKPVLLNGMALRLDGNRMCNADSMSVTYLLSNTTVSPYTLTDTYVSNHGKDVKTLLDKVTIKWPATATPTGPPQAFLYPLDFTKSPFLYTGKANLCWEIRVRSRTAVDQRRFDAVYTVSTAGTKFGISCVASANGNCSTPETTWKCNAYAWAYIKNEGIGWSYKAYARHLGDNQPAVLYMGLRKDQYLGIPLPFDLGFLGVTKGPGTTNCHLNIAPLLAFGAGVTKPYGAGTMNWQGWINYPLYASPFFIPYDPAFLGQRLYTQYASLDDKPSQRQAPLVFSCGVENAFTTWDPVSRVYTTNSYLATQGYLGHSTGVIVRFSHL